MKNGVKGKGLHRSSGSSSSLCGLLSHLYALEGPSARLVLISHPCYIWSAMSLIVSWNFKHIVHCEKIPLYNAVNALRGYTSIGICSPLEVIRYEG